MLCLLQFFDQIEVMRQVTARCHHLSAREGERIELRAFLKMKEAKMSDFSSKESFTKIHAQKKSNKYNFL